MSAQTRQHFITAIEKAHGRELRRFLSARLRNSGADIPDLIQEIYLRVLRLKDYEAIRNPQAYLYTIASHVLHQHALRRESAPPTMDPLDVVSTLQSVTAIDPADEAEIEQRIEGLGRALEAHSPNAHAALLMYRCEGLTLKQVAERMGVSIAMVRKHLARALQYCHQYMDEPP